MKMLKKSLAMLLSVAIVFSACVAALSVSAETETEVPAYDAELHEIITDSSAVTTQSTIGLDKTVYGSFDLSEATSGDTWNDRVLLYLGHFTHDWVRTDSTTGHASGNAFLVFNRHTDGLDLQMTQDDGSAFYWGANYKKFAYPDGTMAFTGPYEVAYSLSATNLTVWMNGTVVINYDYNSWSTSSGAQFTTVLDSFVTGHQAYSGAGGNPVANVSNYKVWKEKEIIATPIYDELQHEIITDSSAVTTQSTIGLDKTVYGSFDLSEATSGSTWNDRVLLYLGHFTHDWVRTDSATGHASGNAFLVFNRHTDGLDLQMTQDDGSAFYWGGNYKKFAYPDGTMAFTGPYEVAYSLSATNLKVWMNGTVVINYDYNSWSTSSGAQFTTVLDSFVTGHQAYSGAGGNPVANVSNYKVWTDKVVIPTPVYNAVTNEIITESAALTSQSVGLDKTVYGSFTLSAATDGSTYNDRVVLYLGYFTIDYVKTDSTTGSRTGNVMLIFNRSTDGLDLQMATDDGGRFYWGANYKKFDYPDGTKNFTGPYEVVYSLSATNLTVWMNDTVVIDYDYNTWLGSSNTRYTTKLDSFVTGCETFGNPAVSTVSNYKIWTDKEMAPTPVYNVVKNEIVTESSALASQSAIGLDKTVYGSFTLSAATDGNAYNDRVVLYLGHFTHNWVETNNATGSASGNAFLVFNRHTDGMDIQQANDDGTYFWWGANYKKFIYPDGTKNFTGPYEVVYSLSATNLTVWMNDIVVIDYDYNSWTGGTTQFTTKLNSFVTGAETFGNPAVATVSNYKVWTDKEIIPAPVYNVVQHEVIADASAVISQSAIGLDKTVYGSFTLSAATSGSAYNDRVLLYLGRFTHDWVKTDSTTGNASGNAYIAFNRSTDGMDLQMLKDDGSAFWWGANYKKFAYPDGTKTFTGPYEVVYSLSATNLTVWMNDVVVINYDYNSWSNSGGTQYTTKLDSFVTGHQAYGNPAVASVSNYKIWTEKTAKLGDLNSDYVINLLDLVCAKKYACGQYEVANEDVVAFESVAVMLVRIIKHILGIAQIENQENLEKIESSFSNALNTIPVVNEITSLNPTGVYEGIKAVWFEGLDRDGKKTKVFAYIGFPEGASSIEPVPAIVLNHGGGGHAYLPWVKKWNDNGYAAIAIDNTGYFPNTVNAGSSEGDGSAWTYGLPDILAEEGYVTGPDNDNMSSSGEEASKMWMYHAVGQTILANNILRADDRVDSSKIGVTGISWGGVITSIAIGYDSRFAFAIPIYGSGYLDESLGTVGNFFGGTKTQSLQDRLNSLDEENNTGNVIVVDASGSGDYTTIQAAVDAANDGDTIYIKNGTYYEAVDCRYKCIHFVGEDKNNTILTYTNKSYTYSPLEMSKGSVSNITIHATKSDNPESMTAYCIHADWDEQEGHTLTIKDCIIINDDRAAIGIGLRANSEIIFQNCHIESKSGSAAAYFHDDAAHNNSQNQRITFDNCTITSNGTEPTILLQSQQNDCPDSSAILCVQNCEITNNGSGKAFSATAWGIGSLGSNPWGDLTTWSLDPVSSGNTVNELNVTQPGITPTEDLWLAQDRFSNVKMPVLWLAWNDDSYFSIYSNSKSYLSTVRYNSDTRLSLVNGMGHSHGSGWNPDESILFANSVVFGSDKLTGFVNQPTGKDIDVKLNVAENATVSSAVLYYITEKMSYSTYDKHGYGSSNTWMTQEWQTSQLTVNGETIIGTVPETAKGYYIEVKTVIDGKTYVTTSAYQEID